MTTNEEGVQNYLSTPNFLQYSQKKDLEPKEDDFFARIKLKKKEEDRKNDTSEKEKKTPLISETLNSMFPPKQWEENGHKFIQYVSPKSATREKSRDLFKALDMKLKERRAKEKGICPVREELYSQCFDEIIRQVTIDNAERGLLLLKVRDEIKMSIASYKILYESDILYGIRKQQQAEDAREKSRDLFKALDLKLKERRAKEKGICPVREELYSQCFDEIIRQVTIDNAERGLLLLKVRDEIKMSIASYQILYESAILYGIRKQQQAEDAREQLKKELEEKEKKNIELTNKKIELEKKLRTLKKHFEERKEIEANKREKDINFLNQQKESLEKILKNISQPIK